MRSLEFTIKHGPSSSDYLVKKFTFTRRAKESVEDVNITKHGEEVSSTYGWELPFEVEYSDNFYSRIITAGSTDKEFRTEGAVLPTFESYGGMIIEHVSGGDAYVIFHGSSPYAATSGKCILSSSSPIVMKNTNSTFFTVKRTGSTDAILRVTFLDTYWE